MATGAYVYRDAYYGQRLILTLSRSGNTVSYSVSLQSTGSIYGTLSVTLTGGVSRTVSYTINQSSGFTQQIASGSFTNASATTVHASSTMFWGGTAKVSASISAAGSPPGTPTNLRLSVRDTSAPQEFTLAWNAVSGATSYVIQASQNDGSWYDMTTSTTTSKQVVYADLNIQRKFRVKAKNAVGTGAASAVLGPVYGQQSAPVISDISGPLTAIDLTLTSNAKYKTGWEVELDTPAATETFASTAQTLRITKTVNALTKFRVRGYAGDGDNRGYTAWSTWSDSAFEGSYSAPEITFIDVKRCTSTGVLNEQGQYVKVMSKGTASSVKEGTTETNKVTRQIHYRQLGASAWTLAITLANGINAANWDESTGVTTGDNKILPTNSYEIRYRVSDTYTPVAYEKIVVVPPSVVAFSVSPEGIGAGKIWEHGALDVGGDAYVEGSLHLADPNEIVINGVAYPRTGRISVTRPTLSAVAGGYAAQWTIDPPFVPPEGWGFQAHTPFTNGYGFVFFDGLGQLNAEGKLRLRFWGNLSSVTLTSIGWTLVKIS